jgi:hypothetical protein
LFGERARLVATLGRNNSGWPNPGPLSELKSLDKE